MPKAISYPNGIVTTYEYNEINALVKQVAKNKNGTVIASFEYEIGKNGERTKVTELGRTVEYELGILDGALDWKNGDNKLGTVKVLISIITLVLSVDSVCSGVQGISAGGEEGCSPGGNSGSTNSSNGNGGNGGHSGGGENTSPNNPDDFMPEIPRDKTINANGTQRQTIYTSDHVRIRAEQHPLKPGEVYNPRHYGVHFHVEVRSNTSLSWNNAGNVTKINPPNYTQGG